MQTAVDTGSSSTRRSRFLMLGSTNFFDPRALKPNLKPLNVEPCKAELYQHVIPWCHKPPIDHGSHCMVFCSLGTLGYTHACMALDLLKVMTLAGVALRAKDRAAFLLLIRGGSRLQKRTSRKGPKLPTRCWQKGSSESTTGFNVIKNF